MASITLARLLQRSQISGNSARTLTVGVRRTSLVTSGKQKLPKTQASRQVATLESHSLIASAFEMNAMRRGFIPTTFSPSTEMHSTIGRDDATKDLSAALDQLAAREREALFVRLFKSDPSMYRRVARVVDEQISAEHSKVRLDTDTATASSRTDCTPMPTRKQFLQLHVQSAVPFIGFGLLDNMIMLTVGGAIENTIGISLCLTSLAAAGMGQMVSDACGITLQGLIERFSDQLGLPRPQLTPQQTKLKCVQSFILTSRIFGIVLGCSLGMFPLLFLPGALEE